LEVAKMAVKIDSSLIPLAVSIVAFGAMIGLLIWINHKVKKVDQKTGKVVDVCPYERGQTIIISVDKATIGPKWIETKLYKLHDDIKIEVNGFNSFIRIVPKDMP
jgi:hypothetical protein